MRVAAYQPDIPPNLGALIRLGACLGVAIDVIEPCGFPLGDRGLARAALDYGARAEIRRHPSWPAFLAARSPGRLVLLTTKAGLGHTEFAFRAGDTLLVGRESSGVPEPVRRAADAEIAVRLRPGLRSLNVAIAAAIVLGEGLRQTGGFARPAPDRLPGAKR